MTLALTLAFSLTQIIQFDLGEPARDRKIVLIAGPLDSHPRDTHEYEKNVILLKHCLETSLKDVRVEAHFDGWPADPRTLDDADTIFLTSGGCDRRLEDHPLYVGDRLAQLERQMKRGCGVLFFHWSTFHPTAHHDKITEWVGGYFDYETGPAPRKWYSAIETKEYTTAVGTPDHPVARGVKPFKVREEFYFKIRFRDEDPRLKPILLRQAGGDVRADTVGWAVERADGGRGFGFTGGHFTANWWIPEFRKLVLNAVAWTAKIEVPEGGIESTLEKPARALILTGHNHPAHDWSATTAALLHVLEQDPRLKIAVTENPEDLARLDGVDLLVLNYCNWDRPGLSDAAKKGLLGYLEGGGGLAVVHFANGAWNRTIPAKDSEWEDYRTKVLRRAWMHPDSGHDPFGSFRVDLVKHPLTDGLAPFETTDELYFKQAGDGSFELLATARSKVTGKDEPMAWVYEAGKGRAFQTVLGHAAVSIHKAGPLIRRGAAWAARRAPLSFDPPPDRTEKATLRPGSPWTPKPRPKPPQEQKPSSKIVPSDTGFKGGHWGAEGEKDWVDGRWNQTDVGPFMTSALRVGKETLVRALSIKVDGGGVVFDPDTLTMRAGWTGKFLAFSPARYGLIEMPRIAGELQWTVAPGLKGRYRGLLLEGKRVGLSYDIGGRAIVDWPGAESHEGITAFSRTIEYSSDGPDVDLPIVSLAGTDGKAETVSEVEMAVLRSGDRVAAAAHVGRPWPPLLVGGDRIELATPGAFNAVSAFHKVLVWSGPAADLPKFAALVKRSPPIGPKEMSVPPLWPAVVTKGHVSREKGAYVVDTITAPYDNPWKALLFLGGLDFFENGDAAVCSIHGDVWRVSGIDESLEKLTWRRYATGLYQALGLRILKDQVYVLGRDRITRLHDKDGNGEADFYESFAADLPTTAGGHNYITCLETDAAGNFYFTAWDGLYRVTPGGSKTERIATGFRNPNGLSVGPDGTITVAPQEGEWTPGSMICQVRPGGHYGYGGPRGGVEPPLVYLPRLMDNSTGGQVWVTSERWGPYAGQLLNLSFGRSTMQLILRDGAQGAAVPTGLLFASGVMRGRFHPKDGQLYVAGSKGWVSTAVRDGCLQRVRYTGGPATWPSAFRAERGGLRIEFPEPLDRELAADLDRWAAEAWNYRYSEKYGSPDYSASSPGQEGHDVVEIRAVRPSEDGRSVLLEIPGLKPVHQLRVRYNLRSAKGIPMRGELAATLHRLPP